MDFVNLDSNTLVLHYFNFQILVLVFGSDLIIKILQYVQIIFSDSSHIILLNLIKRNMKEI